MMDNIPLAELPEFFDPLLDYLSRNLPSSLYETIVTVLSQSYAFLVSGFTLVTSLSSWKPWEWEAYTVLPPLIALLGAYYTLLTVYRTTGWMVRIGFWALKWGLIVSLIAAAFGWIVGNDASAVGGQEGVVNAIRGAFQGRGTGSRRTGGTSGGGSRRGSSGRPRPWDSFAAHRNWQYNENDPQPGNNDATPNAAQQVMHQIARAAGVPNVDLIAAARNVLDYLVKSDDDRAGDTSRANGRAAPRRKQPKRKAKTAAERRTRSR
ncbi:hypothetical protein BD410DRAFT_784253 [Rickenella mellea]|uniref:Uncharacterized protein n=1 Tax=Rickenella mellea TaxID=50990 RepID=A0A4Y7QH74_9AGAM|nr:hypothetical protein BD410DRAFT_784253 [Rickenella mellea]